MGLSKSPVDFLCTSITCPLYILNGPCSMSSGSTGVKLKMLQLFSTDTILHIWLVGSETAVL